jgi:hypothetical protein
MLRSTSFLRYSTRLAILLPFAFVAAACGDDASDRGGDAGTGTEAGARPDASAGKDTGTGSDGSSSDAGSDGSVVAPDTTAPTVLASSPNGAAADASPNAELTAMFSEAMAGLSITSGTTFTVKTGAVDVPGTVTYVGQTATFVPTSPLALDTTYTATITTAATDLAGNALAAPYTWSFKTAASAPIGPTPVLLGGARDFVVLAQSAITNVPTSKITGDVGISPAAASYITGFSMTKAGTRWTSPQVVGSLFAADNDAPTPSNLTTAVGNMHTAYTDAAGRPTPGFLNLDSGAIGGETLVPGLYKWTSTVTVPGDIVISGGANDVWIFQITGDLMMSANKSMTMSGGAKAKNVFWQVAGSVDLGVGAHAEGVVLCKTAITLGAGATVNGRLLAQTAVNLASSTLTAPAP